MATKGWMATSGYLAKRLTGGNASSRAIKLRDTSHADPARVIGLTTATLLVVGNVVGTGVFTTTGFLVRDIGSAPAVLAAWLLGGIAALAGALAYAELVAALPRNGGEYALLSRIYHPALGFCAGCVSLVVGFSAPLAASGLAFGAYLQKIVPGMPPTAAALCLVFVLSVLHAARVSVGGAVQSAVTALQLLLLVGFIGLGLLHAEFGLLAESPVPAGRALLSPALAVGLVYISFSYSGWNAAAYVAGEVQRPERNLPRALVVGTSIVIALYVGLNAVFLGAAPASELAGVLEIGHLSAMKLFGSGAATFVAVAVMIGVVTTASAIIVTGPRVYERMGRDYALLGWLTPRWQHGGPLVAIGLQALLASLMIVTASFDALLTYMGFTLALFSGLTVLGVYVLRKREPELARPYRAPAMAIVTALLIMGWMVVFAVVERPLETMLGLGTLVAGLGLYALVRQRPRAPGRLRA
jgi:APA family basic amino acid/polyamine antiporter